MKVFQIDQSVLREASQRFAEGHRRRRVREPLLPVGFENADAALEELGGLLAGPTASGVAGWEGSRLIGYLIGASRPGSHWGPNVWIGPCNWAVELSGTICELYASAAERWVAEGKTHHYVVVPAVRADWVESWFRLGFGLQHVHAVREPGDVPGGGESERLLVRLAEHRDLDSLAELDLLLPAHQARSPVFAAGGTPTLAEARQDWKETLADAASETWVAEMSGRVIGCAMRCPVERSQAHSGPARPENAAILAFAAVRPECRGAGVGRALGQRVLAGARSAGYSAIVTDWRSANLQASRAWTRLGFRETYYRLFRRVD